MDAIRLTDCSEYSIPKHLKLSHVVLKTLYTSIKPLYVDKKIKVSSGFRFDDNIVMNFILDGKTINIIYEKTPNIIYYDDKFYDVSSIELELHYYDN